TPHDQRQQIEPDGHNWLPLKQSNERQIRFARRIVPFWRADPLARLRLATLVRLSKSPREDSLAMIHSNTELLIDYWRGLKGVRALPRRSDVDPSGFARL